MSRHLYAVPSRIREKCDQATYSRWLQTKARAHVKRDRRRYGKNSCTVAGYKKKIHAAVLASENRDYYTGEELDWTLVSKFRNAAAKAGMVQYKKSFALLPTVDHALDKDRRQKFVICSWRVNDAKSDLTLHEFHRLCKLVLDYKKHVQKASRS